MVVLKIYFAAVCILVGIAILITIPVAIYLFRITKRRMKMTFEEWCYNNGYTQLDVDVYNFGKEVFNTGVAEGFEQAIIKECEEKRGAEK